MSNITLRNPARVMGNELVGRPFSGISPHARRAAAIVGRDVERNKGR
jgi:hypothetical protein